MAHVKRTVLVAHSAEKMFGLVAGVADYPKFLPWCAGSSVQDLHETGMTATVKIDFKGLRQQFTTINSHKPFESIVLVLKDGPFSQLNGRWNFEPLGEDACEVSFELNYVFAAGLLGPFLVPVFDAIASSFVDAFVKRADDLY